MPDGPAAPTRCIRAPAGIARPEGVHLETIVLNDLHTWASDNSARPTLHYWRDEADREVDFVCVGALLLQGGDDTFRASDRVLVTPWWRVL